MDPWETEHIILSLREDYARGKITIERFEHLMGLALQGNGDELSRLRYFVPFQTESAEDRMARRRDERKALRRKKREERREYRRQRKYHGRAIPTTSDAGGLSLVSDPIPPAPRDPTKPET